MIACCLRTSAARTAGIGRRRATRPRRRRACGSPRSRHGRRAGRARRARSRPARRPRRRSSVVASGQADAAIHRPRVQVREAEPLRDSARDRGLAGPRGPVDGDDHGGSAYDRALQAICRSSTRDPQTLMRGRRDGVPRTRRARLAAGPCVGRGPGPRRATGAPGALALGALDRGRRAARGAEYAELVRRRASSAWRSARPSPALIAADRRRDRRRLRRCSSAERPSSLLADLPVPGPGRARGYRASSCRWREARRGDRRPVRRGRRLGRAVLDRRARRDRRHRRRRAPTTAR